MTDFGVVTALVFDNLNAASVGCTLLTFALLLCAGLLRKQSPRLESVLAAGLAASALPTGFALLLCAFDPSKLSSMTDYGIHIAVAGFALLYISARAVISGFIPDGETER